MLFKLTLCAQVINQGSRFCHFAAAEKAGKARSVTSVRSTRPVSTVPASCRGSVTVRRAGEAYFVTKVHQTTWTTAMVPF